MKNFILFCFLIMCNCGTPMSTLQCEWSIKYPNKVMNDSEFDSYLEEFNISVCKMDDVIPVKFVDEIYVDSSVIGLCNWSPPNIEIKKVWWDSNNSELIRAALIFHELGHCILNRDHIDDKLDDGCAKSIMNSVIVDEQCMSKHYVDYMEELRIAN